MTLEDGVPLIMSPSSLTSTFTVSTEVGAGDTLIVNVADVPSVTGVVTAEIVTCGVGGGDDESDFGTERPYQPIRISKSPFEITSSPSRSYFASYRPSPSIAPYTPIKSRKSEISTTPLPLKSGEGGLLSCEKRDTGEIKSRRLSKPVILSVKLGY